MSINTERIRALYTHYGPTENLKPNTAVQHIRMLLEEIDALEEELDVTCPEQRGHYHPHQPDNGGEA